MLEAAGVTAVTALTEPQGHVLATDHVLLPRADYAALVALRTRAAAKLAQLKQAPLDSIRAEHLRVLEWLLGEVPHAEAPPHAEASRVRATPVKIGTCADVNARACTVALTAPSGLVEIARDGETRLLLTVEGARDLSDLLLLARQS